MLVPRNPPYKTRKEARFESDMADLIGQTDRIRDDLLENLEYRLARLPEFGSEIRDDIRGVPIRDPAGTVIIIYRVDDAEECITFLRAARGSGPTE